MPEGKGPYVSKKSSEFVERGRMPGSRAPRAGQAYHGEAAGESPRQSVAPFPQPADRVGRAPFGAPQKRGK
jgi:hypothetical protein